MNLARSWGQEPNTGTPAGSRSPERPVGRYEPQRSRLNLLRHTIYMIDGFQGFRTGVICTETVVFSERVYRPFDPKLPTTDASLE